MIAILVVFFVVVVIPFFRIWVALNPNVGESGHSARLTADQSLDYLESSDLVASAAIEYAGADLHSGSDAWVVLHLADGVQPTDVADLLAALPEAAFRDVRRPTVDLDIEVTGTVEGTEIDLHIDCSLDRDPDEIRTEVAVALSWSGRAKTISSGGWMLGGVVVGHGEVTAVPATISEPVGPNMVQVFSMGGWEVTVSSQTAGALSALPFEQVIESARGVDDDGQIEITESPEDGRAVVVVSGLATDTQVGLTSAEGVPVVQALADCASSGVSTLRLPAYDRDDGGRSTTIVPAFVCVDGALAPAGENAESQELAAEILREAGR